MYTFPNAYSTALASPFKENWLVRLYKSDGTYIGISFSTVTMDDSKVYTGSILNQPSVRDEVDFASGSASTGNMSLEVADFTVGSDKLSETLYTGNYINRDVKVYSNLNANTAFANTVQIFTGRLANIDLTEKDRIKIQIIVKRPWDNIDIPNAVSNNGVYQPVIYGDYTGNLYRNTNQTELAPIPFLTSNSNNMWYANHTNESNVSLHFYDSSNKHFPLLSRASATSSTVEGVDAVRILDTITRVYRIKPTLNANDNTSFTNPSQAFNDNVNDHAVSTLTVNDGTDSDSLKIDLPSIAGKITSVIMYLKWDISYIDDEQSTSNQVKFSYIKDYSSSQTEVTIHNDTDVAQSTETASSTGSTNIDNSGTAHQAYTVTLTDNKLPDFIELKHFISQDNNNSNLELSSTLNISDIWFGIVSSTDTANEPGSAGQEKARLQVVYSAHDGFTKSWTSGLAQKPHDIHRDLLYRYLGITGTPTGYSDLDNEKNGVMRFFTMPNKPKSIKNYLDEVAFEGGFVFRFRADDTPMYHFIPNSPSTDITFNHNDMIDLKVGHTGLSQTFTQFTVQFEKLPSEDKYKQKTTHTTSTRTNFYPSGSKENIKEIKLRYLVSSVAHASGNRNDSYLNYYADVVGNIKQLVTFKMVNPTKSNVEVGDIIAFSSMQIDPLSGNWSGLKFIVTSTSRSVGGAVSIQAREI